MPEQQRKKWVLHSYACMQSLGVINDADTAEEIVAEYKRKRERGYPLFHIISEGITLVFILCNPSKEEEDRIEWMTHNEELKNVLG